MSRRRRGERSPGSVHGLALIDKPSGPTSFSVMRKVERTLGAHKAGHGGTLDPLASGLLIVLLGEGTKLTPWVQGRDKRYVATIRFGIGTDTLDADGEVVAEAAVPANLLTDGLPEAARSFVGDRLQRPPVYSALKVGGRSHMSRARAGEEVVVEPRPACCYSIDIIAMSQAEATLSVHVASGYYVRALARDLGEALGVPAHLSALRRTDVGPWNVEGACEPEGVQAQRVTPIPAALPDIPSVTLDANDARELRDGKRVTATLPDPVALALDPVGSPIAMVEQFEGGLWKVKRGFYLPDTQAAQEADSLIDKVAIDR